MSIAGKKRVMVTLDSALPAPLPGELVEAIQQRAAGGAHTPRPDGGAALRFGTWPGAVALHARFAGFWPWRRHTTA